jgi:hypothetical protein
MQEKSLKSCLGSTVHYDSRSMNISKLLYTLARGPLNSVKPKGIPALILAMILLQIGSIGTNQQSLYCYSLPLLLYLHIESFNIKWARVAQ